MSSLEREIDKIGQVNSEGIQSDTDDWISSLFDVNETAGEIMWLDSMFSIDSPYQPLKSEESMPTPLPLSTSFAFESLPGNHYFGIGNNNEQEILCATCGIKSTSQWRRHPQDQTVILCNSCGLAARNSSKSFGELRIRPRQSGLKRASRPKFRARQELMSQGLLACSNCQVMLRKKHSARNIPECFLDATIAKSDLAKYVWCIACSNHYHEYGTLRQT